MPDLAIAPGRKITHDMAVKLIAQAKNAKAALQRSSKDNEATIDSVKQGIETVGGAFAMAVANARFGANGGQVPPQILGFDADLVLGSVGMVMSIIGVAGKYDEDLLNLSTGILSVAAVREGYKVGANMQSKASGGAAPAGSYTGGAAPAGSYTGGAAPAGSYTGGAAPAGSYTGGR
jgi:uncharacterized membrane protein